MEWIKAEIEFASTFSYRMPDTSSQFAIPMLLPGPSTVKLGLVATAILQSGKLTEGYQMFEILKTAEIKFLLPEKIAVFYPLIKRLKPKSAALRTRGFEPTFGTRGYVLYSGPVTLYLGMPKLNNEDFEKIIVVLKCLRRLGTSDSLLRMIEIAKEKPPDSTIIVKPMKFLNLEEVKGGLIQKVKDINPIAKFSDVNPFERSSKNKKKKVFIESFYILPVRPIKEGGKWILYERY